MLPIKMSRELTRGRGRPRLPATNADLRTVDVTERRPKSGKFAIVFLQSVKLAGCIGARFTNPSIRGALIA